MPHDGSLLGKPPQGDQYHLGQVYGFKREALRGYRGRDELHGCHRLAAGPAEGVEAEPGKLAPRKVPRPPVCPLRRDGAGIGARREHPNRGVDMGKGDPLQLDLLFQTADRTADLSTFLSQGGNDHDRPYA